MGKCLTNICTSPKYKSNVRESYRNGKDELRIITDRVKYSDDSIQAVVLPGRTNGKYQPRGVGLGTKEPRKQTDGTNLSHIKYVVQLKPRVCWMPFFPSKTVVNKWGV